jgi:hypothetical protein
MEVEIMTTNYETPCPVESGCYVLSSGERQQETKPSRVVIHRVFLSCVENATNLKVKL